MIFFLLCPLLHCIIFVDRELTENLKIPHMNLMKWHSRFHTLASGCLYYWYSNSSANICVSVTASILNNHFRYSPFPHPFCLRIKCVRNKPSKYFFWVYVKKNQFKNCKITEGKATALWSMYLFLVIFNLKRCIFIDVVK